MMIRQYLRRFATFVMASLALSTAVVMKQAIASDYSTRPIQIIVPFAAGGGADTAVRILQDRLSEELKQPVIIQNLVGAAGIIGTDALKRSNNNGSIIGISLGSTIGTGQIFNKEMPYNYATDFEFVGMLGEIPRGFFVSSQSKYQTLNDLVADSNSNKNFGVPGNSPDHVNAVLFNSMIKSDHQLVPYTANTNTMTMDLLGGRLDGVWQSLPAMNSCLQNSSCRLLAVTGGARHPSYREVPTFAELGFKKINAPSYYGFIAPKGVSDQKLQQLNRAINVVLSDPKIAKKLFDSGVVVSIQDLVSTKQMHFSAVDISKQAEPLLTQSKK